MNLFDPDTYARVRKPLLEAETLPPSCYTSHEFYEREVSNIFLKSWNLIGREIARIVPFGQVFRKKIDAQRIRIQTRRS